MCLLFSRNLGILNIIILNILDFGASEIEVPTVISLRNFPSLSRILSYPEYLFLMRLR